MTTTKNGNLKKNVLVLIPCYLFPNIYGGPITSVRNIVENLSDEFNFYIVAMDRDWNSNERIHNIIDGWNDVGSAKVYYLAKGDDCWGGFYRTLSRVTGEIKIDLVYSNLMFDAKMAIPLFLQHKYGKLKSIPILTATRGDIMPETLKIKPFKKKVYISCMRSLNLWSDFYWQATSITELESQHNFLGVDYPRIMLVENIPTLASNDRKLKKESGNIKIAFLSRINIKKNLDLAITMVNELKGNIEFDIFGAIEHKHVWEKCKQLIKKAPPNVHIHYWGLVNQSEVIDYLSNYHVFLFPTQSENYGHVIVEAIMAGCIPVISDRTPWNDLAKTGAGYVFPLDEYAKFIESLQKLTDADQKTYEEHLATLQIYREERFSLKKVVDQTKDMFNKVINSKV